MAWVERFRSSYVGPLGETLPPEFIVLRRGMILWEIQRYGPDRSSRLLGRTNCI